MPWPKKKKRVRPFKNVSQYAEWTIYNSYRCAKGYDLSAFRYRCDLERTLDAAHINDGTISEEFAKRIGWPNEKDIWRCPEWE